MKRKSDNQFEQANEVLENIRRGGDEALKEIYRTYREDFISWVGSKYSTNREEAADIFQDAVIIFYKNIISGKLTQMESGIKTYLFAIGKNKVLKSLKKNKPLVQADGLADKLAIALDNTVYHDVEMSHRQQFLREALQEITAACREMLTLFYYHRYSMEALKDKMGYSSLEAARTSKHRCLKKLIGIAKERENRLY